MQIITFASIEISSYEVGMKILELSSKNGMKEIDCRGLGCPEPVIRTKKGLKESPDGVDVIVDDRAARENVPRYAEATGYKAEVKQEGEAWRIEIRR